MIIETARLILREYKLEDIKYMVDGLNNYNTAINLTVPYPYEEKYARFFINKHSKHTEFDYSFAIELKEKNIFIGGTSLYFDEESGKYKGGIWLNEKYTNKGYGSEAWIARALFAFEVLGLDEIENGFFEYNEHSWRMQEKIGYVKVGERINYCPALKKEVKEIITNLKKDTFYKLYPKMNK